MRSIRRLSLSRLALDALRRQRAIQAQDKLLAAGAYADHGAVFGDETGDRITPMAATKAFGRIARAGGISTTRLHDMRHTAASHLLASNVDVLTTAGVLGHSNATVTLTTYAHLVGDTQRRAVDVLGARLEQTTADTDDAPDVAVTAAASR